MAPIRKKRKLDTTTKDERNSLTSGSAGEASVDWWEDLSKRIAGRSPSKSPENFETFFRMSRRTFDYICSLVEEHMTGKFMFSCGTPLSLNDKVALALRRLSSGHSLISIGNSFGTHHSTVSQLTWRFVEAMEEKGLQHLRWPSTEQELTVIKSKFENIHGLPNCCGAIDTTHIAMMLSSSERGGEVWRDRKNNYSVTLQAIVDPALRFRDVVTGLPGQMTDESVLESSEFFALCDKGERLNGMKIKLSRHTELREYIVGDSAFPLLPWLLTPYQGNDLSGHKAEFNKRHLATHLIAQRALARLKGVWKMIQGVMWRPDKHKLPRIILVCCILHNIVIDMEDEILNALHQSNDHDPGYSQEVCESVENTASVSRNKLSKYLSRRPNS